MQLGRYGKIFRRSEERLCTVRGSGHDLTLPRLLRTGSNGEYFSRTFAIRRGYDGRVCLDKAILGKEGGGVGNDL